jgi:hypothetical protein
MKRLDFAYFFLNFIFVKMKTGGEQGELFTIIAAPGEIDDSLGVEMEAEREWSDLDEGEKFAQLKAHCEKHPTFLKLKEVDPVAATYFLETTLQFVMPRSDQILLWDNLNECLRLALAKSQADKIKLEIQGRRNVRGKAGAVLHDGHVQSSDPSKEGYFDCKMAAAGEERP